MNGQQPQQAAQSSSPMNQMVELRYHETGKLVDPYKYSMMASVWSACYALATEPALRGAGRCINVVSTNSGEIIAKLEGNQVFIWNKVAVQFEVWQMPQKKGA